MALLRDHLAPRLLGRDPACTSSHLARPAVLHPCHHVGAITSLALAAIDTALWDWKLPPRRPAAVAAAGGAKDRVPVYTTEGGWLHLEQQQLVRRDAGRAGERLSRRQGQGRQAARGRGRGAHCGRARSGGPGLRDDGRRQPVLHRWTRRCAARRCCRAGGSAGSRSRCPPTTCVGARAAGRRTTLPIAVGESLYSPASSRVHAARRLLHRAGGRGARGRHHAVAEGGAHRRELQPAGGPAFPDGAARLAGVRGAQRRAGWSTSRSSTPWPPAAWSSPTAVPRRPTPPAWASSGCPARSPAARRTFAASPDPRIPAMSPAVIRIHPADNVVIARRQLLGGTVLADEGGLTVAGLVPPGHKVATAPSPRAKRCAATTRSSAMPRRHCAGPARAHAQPGLQPLCAHARASAPARMPTA
jgi:hypothetical protein